MKAWLVELKVWGRWTNLALIDGLDLKLQPYAIFQTKQEAKYCIERIKELNSLPPGTTKTRIKKLKIIYYRYRKY